MDLIDPEVVEMEDLVRRYLPDRVPQLTIEHRLAAVFGGGFVVWSVGVTILASIGIWTPVDGFSLLASLLGLLSATAVGSEILFRLHHRKQLARFRADLATGALLGAVAERFREEIEKYRGRTLGPSSDWARARDPLSKAKDEANRAVEYWSERAKDEDMAEIAETKLALARTLRTSFGKAIAEIDERTEALRAFFNRCEAKLIPLKPGGATRRKASDWHAYRIKRTSRLRKREGRSTSLGGISSATSFWWRTPWGALNGWPCSNERPTSMWTSWRPSPNASWRHRPRIAALSVRWRRT